jgi:hypothetical protein
MVIENASPGADLDEWRPMTKHQNPFNFRRVLALAVTALLPAACVAPGPPPPPANPFFGSWTSGERDRLTFRDTTIVQSPAEGGGTALGPESCGGKFRFGYSRMSRDALMASLARQPDLRGRLNGMLRQPEYPVAELGCDNGNSTYVLLDDRDVVAIYRDGDVAGLQNLSRL